MFAIFTARNETHRVIPEQLPGWLRIPLRWCLNRQLRKRRTSLPCPCCRQPVAIPLPLADMLWDTLAQCRGCGHALSVLALCAPKKSPEEQAVADVASAEKPPRSRIEVENTGAECIWRIPAKGGWSFMLTFATLWLTFSTGMLALFAFSAGDGKTPGTAVFLSAFVLIGIGFLYAGLRMTRASHTLRLDASEFVFERRFLGRTRRKAWPRGSVRSVALVEFYSENYQPVHGIEVRGERGKIRFGSALVPMEKAWLCRELRIALGLEISQRTADMEHPASVPRTHGQDPSDSRRIRIEKPEGCCVVTVPPGRKVWFMVVMGCLALASGGFMIYQGLRGWIPIHGGPPIPFLIVFNGFVVFLFAGVAATLPVAIGLVTVGWTLARTHQTIAANAARVVIETRCGSWKHQEIWEAAAVRDVTVEPAFEWTSNGRRKDKHRAVILLPDRVRGFGISHSDGDLALAVAALREALGKGSLPS